MFYQNLLSYFKVEWLRNNLDTIEFIILLILIIITIFRRKISSNHEYRMSTTKTDKLFRDPIISTTSSIKKLNFKLAKEKITSSIKRFRNKHLKYIELDNSIDHEMMNETNNKNTFQIDDFSIEILINIVSYLKSFDIVNLKSISKQMHQNISDECLWEQLWIQTYGQMWLNPTIRKIREDRGIFWSPFETSSPLPSQGWYLFYLMFEVCWVDWILAGYCTQKRSLLGIDNSIFDVTKFISKHPGSLETITEGAGCDATEIFLEIGHSTHALELMKNMYVWDSHDIRKNPSSCLCSNRILCSNTTANSSSSNSNNELYCNDVLSTSKKSTTTTKDRYMTNNIQSRCRNTTSTCQKIESCRNMSGLTRLHVQMKINAQKISNLAYSRRYEHNRSNTIATNDINNNSSSSDTLEAMVVGTSNNDVNNSINNSSFPSIAAICDRYNHNTSDIGLKNNNNNNNINNNNNNNSNQLSSMQDFVNNKINKNHYKLRKLSYFGPTISMIPTLNDYYNCRTSQSHFGQAKTFFDPIRLEYWVWWTCCGKGQLLIEPELVAASNTKTTTMNEDNSMYSNNSYFKTAFDMFTFNYSS